MSNFPVSAADSAPLTTAILAALRGAPSPLGPTELAALVGSDKATVAQRLARLVERGEVEKVKRGLYRLPSPVDDVAGKDETPQAEPTRRPLARKRADVTSIEYRVASGQVGANWMDGATHDDGEYVRLPRHMVQQMIGHVPDPQRSRWTYVRGDSMEPYLPDGMPIFVERVHGVSQNGRYVLWYDDDIEIVKRVEVLGAGHLLISADNKVYPAREYYYRTNGTWDEVIEPATEGKKAQTRTVTFYINERVVFPPDTSPAIVRQISSMFNDTRR